MGVATLDVLNPICESIDNVLLFAANSLCHVVSSKDFGICIVFMYTTNGRKSTCIWSLSSQ